MDLKKPTIKRCIDGEEHVWLVVNEDTDIISRKQWQRRWCQKCGSLTQVNINVHGEVVALMNDKNKPHLVLTELSKLLSKRAAKSAAKPTAKPAAKSAAKPAAKPAAKSAAKPKTGKKP